MLRLRTLTVAAATVLLTACTATTPTRPDSAAAASTETPAEKAEPAAAPEASAPDEDQAGSGEAAAQPGTDATGSPKQIYYTENEYTQMTACVGLADAAMHTAIRKRSGMELDDAKNIYRSRPHPDEHMAIVEQVYADTVGNVWDYTVRQFQQCSALQAQVPPERLQLASYCMQRQMIGDLTYSFKASGRPISDAYGYFAKFTSPVVKQIIDAVYATDAAKDEVKTQLWTSCMTPITG
ncbi:hypothetical protein G3580_17720 [Nitrogeniibacter mangrovi]|uniref:Lipoprotein n=1 Tax=Nitrogeniibacter mangrovi TaxID=2016596 RepID=A0A6C1B6D6_9RHOO|nr:hypothetical protein [Nitrogeniibacter mangrovi]QID19292.1 hypothetical protein G3580_17720 [Nitrogeniibacter mangrovi]